MDVIDHIGAGELAAAGLGDWPFGVRDRVRFHELDTLGHVNNVTYVQWFETVRVGYMAHYGFVFGPDQPQYVIARQSVEYHAPLVLGDRYVLAARVVEYGRTSFTQAYACHAGDRPIATGRAIIALREPDGSAARPLPDAMVAAFRDTDGAKPRS